MNVLDRFSKNFRILHFIEVRRVGADRRTVVCTDGQTDMKLIVSFRNFTIAPNLLRRGNIFNKNRHVMHVACSIAVSEL
jgi:hypothetical protein